MVSRSVEVSVSSGRVLSQFNMCAKSDDHRPISLKVTIPMRPRSVVKARRAALYDCKAVGVIDNDTCCVAAMALCLVDPYDVDSHPHVHIIEQHVVSAMAWAYPLIRPKIKNLT